MKNKILITGGNGQLAQSINALTNDFSDFIFFFVDSQALDITKPNKVQHLFDEHKFDWCINCAAYTAVDKAETERDIAHLVNVKGAKIIANNCKENNVKLIHISTDFVFDGSQNRPYKEEDFTNPRSVYGKTKLMGEREVEQSLREHFIIRTSWLYSEFGHNFFKTMLNLSKIKDKINVVDDQLGSPTYARNLAEFILQIISANSREYGTYHYCNKGEISWYGFAKKIFDLTDSTISVKSISSENYPMVAKRPKYSVLDTSKTTEVFKVTIPDWQDSLKEALKNL